MIGINEEVKNTDPTLLSPLTLAFVGDTVFDLLVRGNLVMRANRPVGKLHPIAAKSVCASAQARAAQIIAPLLTEQERLLALLEQAENVSDIIEIESRLAMCVMSWKVWSHSFARLTIRSITARFT